MINVLPWMTVKEKKKRKDKYVCRKKRIRSRPVSSQSSEGGVKEMKKNQEVKN
jgi:hypothetical protein